ncbi:MAG: ATP-grasp domain-containing protein, partial [Methanobrevibacter sp.]|nr:ATP-grasp domain-containing protein [Methanobrevibacter sp.]
PLKEKVFKYAKLACEYVPGLKGFVGIDFIIEDDYIYLLEINSRFTTSYVGLQKIININIAKTIIDLIDKKIGVEDIGEINYSSKASFYKNDDGILEIKIEDN